MDEAAEIEALLLPYVDKTIGNYREGAALSRMFDLMAAVGNPHLKLRAIHIAGTSGKTSTGYYLASMLQTTDKTVGLTVSPHVDSITERIQIDGKPLSADKFLNYLKSFLELVGGSMTRPSYFELLYGFAVWVFAQTGVDYAVIETGIGGMYDATNVLRGEDKICLITDIGYDHMELLGSDIRDIAAQKAGIIHHANIAITYRKPRDVMEVFEKRAANVGAELLIVEDNDPEMNFSEGMASYQKHNWALAKAAYDVLSKRDGLPGLSEDELRETQKTYVPGRMDIVEVEGVTVIMDGAHNAQKIEALAASFGYLFPDKKAIILLSLKRDKDQDGIAEALKPIASKIITTEFVSGEYLRAKAVPADILADRLRFDGITDVGSEVDFINAFELALKEADGFIIVTGSFYLLSQLRLELQKQKHAKNI